MDTLSKEERSALMARIRQRGNKSTELRLVQILRRSKISGWRRNQTLFGSPDFLFRRQQVAVFVDGCFWHGCPRCFKAPEQNRSFWVDKIQRNKRRDAIVSQRLRKEHWKVVRIWEHELDGDKIASLRIRRAMKS